MGKVDRSMVASAILASSLAAAVVVIQSTPQSSNSRNYIDGQSLSDPWPIELTFNHPHAEVRYKVLFDNWDRWFVEEKYNNRDRVCRAYLNQFMIKSTAREYECQEAVVSRMELKEGGNLMAVPQLPRLGSGLQKSLDEAGSGFRGRSLDFAQTHGIPESAIRGVSGDTESGLTRHSLVLSSVGLPLRHEWHDDGRVVREWEVKGIEIRSNHSVQDLMSEGMRDALGAKTTYEDFFESLRRQSGT